MLNNKVRHILITLIVLLSISIDQISKIWVRNNFESYNETSIIGDIFTLIKVENTGAFLGMGSELSEIPRVFLLIILPVVVLISITIYTYIDKTLDKISIIGFSLIIGGGVANIFDRIVYGSVTDFLYINLGGIFKTGIFNIADLSVTTGMILILISSFKRRN
ncbi:MAG: signal peptidase II [Flavobacteriaceae bacterium]|jgi:signal peptidase II|nr:signal peptidase II [Flavobacteriales bacterium]RCL69941.1 MAG: signal peptidase II [Bacteroidota bacterium]|tara:strand:+ start:532 stop:1020 length:489 start_codon:yes stop_codon:yes gene_type:complete